MNIHDDLPDESDTSDEDYDPGFKEDENSEVDSDGDPEEPLSENEGLNIVSKKRKKGKLKGKKFSKKLSDVADTKENEIQIQVNDDEKKKEEDDLWADFMKDTGFVSKNSSKRSATPISNKPNTNGASKKDQQCDVNQTIQKAPEKVKIKQIFEFAGEEVEVEREVPANSAEARLLDSSPDNSAKIKNVKRTAGLSGIGNVLSQLSKKPKISTLEKTKLDWDSFKKEENLEEELSTYNKGKKGYLDRQEFLERADHRRFEIEKELRTIERNKRFNSAL